MSIKFASICPHYPAIIPTIGSSSDFKKLSKTIEAMKRLSKIFAYAKPETAIVISPHGPVNYTDITITMSPVLSGNFQTFGDHQTEMRFENDLEIVDLLYEKCKEQKIPAKIMDSPLLDYGSLVPLYYLTKEFNRAKVVPIAHSFSEKQIQFEFGKIIYEICNIKNKTKKKRFAVIASADLSHRLTPEAPTGFSIKGAEFDEKFVNFLSRGDFEGILNMNSDLVRQAGECGYLPTVILFGVLSAQKPKFEIFSYENPLGIGCLVSYFSL